MPFVTPNFRASIFSAIESYVINAKHTIDYIGYVRSLYNLCFN